MSLPMNQEFVFSFVAACEKAGLTKEATAALLQKESTDQARRADPSFNEGFEKVASQVPGGLRVFINDDSLTKEAAGNFKKIFDGIRLAMSGVKGGATSGAKATKGGVKNVFGKPGWVTNNPRTALAAGTGITGAGAYGINKLFSTPDYGMDDYDPYMPTGGYDEQDSAGYVERITKNVHGPGIASSNKRYGENTRRMRELEAAVDRNDHNSGKALQDLQHLRAEQSGATRTRGKYLQDLDRYGSSQADRLQRLAEQKADNESDRTSLWGMPRRMWSRIKGEDPNDYYDNQALRLQRGSAAAQTQLDITNRRKRLMEVGYTGELPAKKPEQTSASRFFPTY